MRVLVTVVTLNPAAGGVPEAVQALCAHLARNGLDIEIVTCRSSPDAPVQEPSHDRIGVTYATSKNAAKRYWEFWRKLAERLDAFQPDVVHNHGLWRLTSVVSAIEAHRKGYPHLVSPHGMLEPWAFQHHQIKKTAAWYGYQRTILENASLLHATAPMEAENLRAKGLSGPVAVIPNGVPLPKKWKETPSTGTTRQALFLSRIHPKKGLPNLLTAWASLRPRDWQLVIAGPDEDHHRQEIEEQVRRHDLQDVVEFPGPVRGREKWELYRNSDLFVLPTHSENFGVVVAEALASGLPVITTTGAPWQVLEENDCGWWVEPAPRALEGALSEAVSLSDEKRLAMGQRGRVLVEERFSWSQIAREMNRAYEWILGKREAQEALLYE